MTNDIAPLQSGPSFPTGRLGWGSSLSEGFAPGQIKLCGVIFGSGPTRDFVLKPAGEKVMRRRAGIMDVSLRLHGDFSNVRGRYIVASDLTDSLKTIIETFMPEWAPTNNENPRLGSQHETIGDQREPTHWEFCGEGPGTVFLQKKGVPGAFNLMRSPYDRIEIAQCESGSISFEKIQLEQRLLR